MIEVFYCKRCSRIYHTTEEEALINKHICKNCRKKDFVDKEKEEQYE